MEGRDDIPDEVLDRLASLCLALPEAHQQRAWIGTRWQIRKRTFAHVLPVAAGSPAAYAEAAEQIGPIVVMTFRAPVIELDAMAESGFPYFKAHWGRDVGGIILGPMTDWAEIDEILTESYCRLAPKFLVRQVDRPEPI